jgi:hypothetical protein
MSTNQAVSSSAVPSLTEIDLKQRELDLRVDHVNLPLRRINRYEVYVLYEWVARTISSLKMISHADTFRDQNYKYSSLSTVANLLHPMHTQPENRVIEDIKKTLNKKTSFSRTSTIFPFLRDLFSKNSEDYTTNLLWDVTLISPGVIRIVIYGDIKKLVIDINVAKESFSLCGLVKGYDGAGEIFIYYLRSLGLIVDDITFLLKYRIKDGDATLAEIPLSGITGSTVINTLGIYSGWSDKKELFTSLLDPERGLSLESARLTEDLTPMDANPSADMLEFQKLVISNHKRKAYPTTYTGSRDDAVTLVAEHAVSELGKIRTYALNIKRGKDVLEGKMNDLCDFTGISRPALESKLKVLVSKGTPEDEVAENLFKGNVFTLAEKFGLSSNTGQVASE